MYESFFQLQNRPFSASPVADRYFAFGSIEHARETITRCIERGEGPAVVLGAAGTGKSTLCQVLAAQLQEKFRIATLASARLCTRRALLQNILFELQLPYRDREEGELRLSLIDYLQPSESCPHGMLLIVDEAHMLPLRLLEEIRMITNLVRDGEPRVRLVLAASLMLDERLASPRLESFNQRIAARCYLQSMNRDETCGYVQAHIRKAGGNPDEVFAETALHAIYRATDGIPRLVNQVCDHVLMMAAIGRQAPVDAAGVEEAWADLQQLPTPWATVDRPSPDPETGILEFGELDDSVCSELETAEKPEPVAESATGQAAVSDAVERLDEVQTGISAMAQEESPVPPTAAASADESQFHPPAGHEPEIELVFHHAHDPFNERFEDEEVIVDPIASLDKIDGPLAASPTLSESQECSTIPLAENAECRNTGQESVTDAAFDPVLPVQPEQVQVSRPSVISGSESSLPGDDRDLLEVHQDAAGGPHDFGVITAENQPRRREYRQLFATLRRR
jgi:type II secretory pathway predicted ATPase ExeA